jgi:PhnB protein
MARLTTYLNFPRNTEKVFDYYNSILGGGIARFSDIPLEYHMPKITDEDKFGIQWMFTCNEK